MPCLAPQAQCWLQSISQTYAQLFTPTDLAKLQGTGKAEWHLYMSMAKNAARQSESFDIFDWWESNRALMPTITAAALAALATPLHSMDVERVFSRLGGLITPQRMGLQADAKWTHVSFMVHGDVRHCLV